MKNPIKKFEEDKKIPSSMFFKAAPRPVTSHARHQVAMSEQQS